MLCVDFYSRVTGHHVTPDRDVAPMQGPLLFESSLSTTSTGER